MKKKWIKIIIASLAAAILLFLPVFVKAVSSVTGVSEFVVYFLDVGEGDSSVIVCDGHAMIIDGGDSGNSGYIYSFLKNHAITKLDYVVCTHPDADHVGGLSGALNYAKANRVFCTVADHNTDTFKSFAKYSQAQGKKIEVPAVGDTFSLGSAKIKIVGPYELSGNSSLVLRIEYGETSFLFTGDAELSDEKEILEHNPKLKSTVLKVGHHGSGTSTSVSFLDSVAPEYAVITVGGDNSYGHPAEAVLERLREAGVRLYRTDMQGLIECRSDGKALSFTVEKNSDADTYIAAGGYANHIKAQMLEEKQKPEEARKQQKDGTEEGTVIKTDYVLNTKSYRFHYPGCRDAENISQKNKSLYLGTREDLIAMGYSPCGHCKP